MYFVHIYVDFWKDSEKNKHLFQTLKSQIVFLHRFRDSREHVDHRATPKKTIHHDFPFPRLFPHVTS